MKYRFIPACVMLTAGLVCCIMSIVQRWDVTYSLIALLGQIAAQVIGKVIADHEAMVKAEEERLRREEELAAEEAEKEKAEQENNEDNEAETL